MADTYTMQWVGWDNTYEKGTQTQHDKVWGWFTMKDGREFCFWGRRGKQLAFKQHPTTESAKKVMRQKENKKYNYVPAADYNTLVKDFLDEVELWCCTAILSDTVR